MAKTRNTHQIHWKNEFHQRFAEYLNKDGRKEVLNQIGISLTTLIALRDWKFEWQNSPSIASNRMKRSWAKTLVRVANAVGGEPEDWIKAVGWEIDESIQESLNHEKRITVPEDFNGSLARIYDRRELTAAYVVYEPFGLSQQANTKPTNFHRDLLNRLLCSVIPDGTVDLHDNLSLGDALEKLHHRGSEHPKYDLVAGLFDLPDRRLNGNDFIPLRGWSIPLNGVFLGKVSLGNTAPKWSNVVFQRYEVGGARKPFPVIAIPGESGHAYLRGTCGYRNALDGYLVYQHQGSDLLFGEKETPTHAECLLKTSINTSQENWGGAIFVSDQFTCLRLENYLNTPKQIGEREAMGANLRKGYLLEDPTLKPEERFAPRFQLGLAVANGLHDPQNKTNSKQWSKYMTDLVNVVTYGYDWLGTAKIYAEQILDLYEHHSFGHLNAAIPEPFLLNDQTTSIIFWNEVSTLIAESAKPGGDKLVKELERRIQIEFPHWRQNQTSTIKE